MKQGKFLFEAILLGAATSALCIVAILTFNAPKQLDSNSQVDSYELSDEEYYFDDEDDYFEADEDDSYIEDYYEDDSIYQVD